MTRRQKAERGRSTPLAARYQEPQTMKHKVKHVHFVGMGGTDASREQGPLGAGTRGWDRPRAASAAGCVARDSESRAR